MNRYTEVLRYLGRINLGRLKVKDEIPKERISYIDIHDLNLAQRLVNGEIEGYSEESWLDRLYRKSSALEKAFLGKLPQDAQAGDCAIRMIGATGASYWRSVRRESERLPTFKKWLNFNEEVFGRYVSNALLSGMLISEMGEDHPSVKFYLDILELLVCGCFPCGWDDEKESVLVV